MLGHDIEHEGAAIRRLVGYMPEHDCLPPDVSASDFVVHMARMSGLPRAAARERAADVLRHVGLDEERYRPMGGYSTGMKQRAKLAQALVHDPQLVLLDEPTNGLDPAARDDMLRLVAAHRQRVRHRGPRHLAPARRARAGQRPRRRARRRPAAALRRHRRLPPRHRQPAGRGASAHDAERDRLGEALARRRPHRARAARGPHRPAAVELPRRAHVHDLIRDVTADLGLGLVRLQPDRRHRSRTSSCDGGAGRPPGLRALPRARPAPASSTTSATATTTAPRDGTAAIARALFVTGLRHAYGLGRSGKSKVMPFLLLAMSVLPALIVVGVRAC